MPQRLSVVCEEDLLERVDLLAREYDLSRQEVLRQALEAGLESIESDHRNRA